MFKDFSPSRRFDSSRRTVLAAALGATLAFASSFCVAATAGPLKVVASFSILGDMVNVIGGEQVDLTTIVGANGDSHSFEPTPKDSKALAQAQLLIVNGLGFEAWLPRLVKSSGFKGVEVVASNGVKPRMLDGTQEDEHDQASKAHDHADDKKDHAGHSDDDSKKTQSPAGDEQHHHGNVDPHAWQSLENGVIYATNIANALSKADPQHAKDYQQRAKLYIAAMKKLDAEIKQTLNEIPQARRKVVTSHDAFGYFGQAYGVEFISAVGFSSDAEPSAKEMAAIIDQVKKEHVPAVFVERITSAKLIKQIAAETGAKVGGTLYSDALGKPDEPAGTYLGMFTWNAGRLIYALQENPK